MKMLLGWLLPQILCMSALAQSLPPKELGHPFQLSTNIDLHWSAAKINLPSNLWTYRVLPSVFPPAAITNLKILASFTEKDQDRSTALNPIFNQPDRLAFTSPDQTRELGIYPNLGWIYYTDSKAVGRRNGNGVPRSEKKTLQLAIRFIKTIKINPSDLATKPHSSDFQASYILGKLTVYHTNSTETTFVDTRGVMIARAVDGVTFWAKGNRDGFIMEFGNDAKVSHLEILWRNLQHDVLYPVVKPEAILKWIREGKTLLDYSLVEDLDWNSVKKMTVKKITPYYFGENHDVIQDSIRPFAMVETSVDTGKTNRNVYLYCPIIDDTKH